MRSLLARLALAGTVGIALAGCGTQNGSSLPVGAAPNGAGGGPVNFIPQGQPSDSVVSILVDGGTLAPPPAGAGAYTGFNTTATDAQSANDAGPDVATAGSAGKPVAPAIPLVNPPGSHLISFAANNLKQEILAFGGTVPTLVEPATAPGNFVSTTYGALVLFATVTGTAPSSLAVEITGGAGAAAFDTRITCPATPSSVVPGSGLTRYVCPLPAYGAATNSVTLPNPVTPGATGAFTPIQPAQPAAPALPVPALRVFIVLNYAAATSVPGTLNLDFIYAEQGTK